MFKTTFTSSTGFGVLNAKDELVAAIIFSHYDPDCRSIDVSFVADTPKCLTRSMIKAIFDYPFGQLGLQRVQAVTPRDARTARRFLEKFGFKREGLARKGFGEYGDAVLYGLLDKEWRASRFCVGALDGQENPDRSGS